jgi:transcriptional regulator with GAF, ATPase, and Fis domain
MPKIIVKTGNNEKTFDFNEDVVTIGRSAVNLIEIDDINSSRYHCKIQKTPEGFEVVDLGSRNGTIVNGKIVLRKALVPGDCIEIGQTFLYFEQVGKTSDFSETAQYATNPSATVGPAGERPAEARPTERKQFQPTLAEMLKLLEINKALNSELNLKKLLEFIMDNAIVLVDAERGFLLLQEKSGKLAVKVSRNIDKETIKKPEFKVSQSIAKRVFSTGETLITSDAQEDDRLTGFMSVHGLKLRSVLCAPLKSRNAISGVIYVDNRFEKNVFSPDRAALLEILCDQAAVAVENARLFEENMEKQTQLEKQRLELEVLSRKQAEKIDLQAKELSKARQSLAKKDYTFKYDYSHFVTRSQRMNEIFSLLDNVIDSDAPLLIQGESGTGKELIAKAVHVNSPRKSYEFVTENCAAIPANLLESEFFGYVRGAFTGAGKDKKGLFEVAHKGTLFLDEIGEMDLSLQSKFLRALQEGEIRRVGGKDFIKVDVRIISASNKDLFQLTREKLFREDLYYRLNVINVTLPPLRERTEDIPLLVEHFLGKIAAKSGAPKKTMHPTALEILMGYNWPGNARQLENEIERAVAMSKDTIMPENLSEELIPKKKRSYALTPGKAMKDVVADVVKEVEMEVILKALEETGWNKSQAAELLDVSRPTLDAKIEMYHLKKDGEN